MIGGVKIEYVPARPGDYAGKEVSAAKILRELKWEPKIGFEEGMRRTIEWFEPLYQREPNARPRLETEESREEVCV